MHIAGDPKFQKMLASNSGGNERLIFSIIGVKVNRKGKSQERALVITNRAIYNTIPSDIRKCQRRIPLDKLHHVRRATHAHQCNCIATMRSLYMYCCSSRSFDALL